MNYAYARRLAVAVVMSSINGVSALSDEIPSSNQHQDFGFCSGAMTSDIRRTMLGLNGFQCTGEVVIPNSAAVNQLKTYGQPDMMILPPDGPPKPGELFRVDAYGTLERINTKWHLKDGKLYLGDTGIYISYAEKPNVPYTLHYGDRPVNNGVGLSGLKSMGETAAAERAEFGK